MDILERVKQEIILSPVLTFALQNLLTGIMPR